LFYIIFSVTLGHPCVVGGALQIFIDGFVDGFIE